MTGLWVTAGFVVAACIGVPIAFAFMDRHQESAWRREAGQGTLERGRHRALKPLPAVIPRPPTEHAPPWDPEPEPVIEPAAFLAAPVAEPPPDAIIIATAVRTDGQVHSVRTAVLPPVLPGELIPPVAALLGYPSVDAAMDALCAGLHSWESNFTKGDTRLVRALTDGAP